jgi:hypothetical protein
MLLSSSSAREDLERDPSSDPSSSPRPGRPEEEDEDWDAESPESSRVRSTASFPSVTGCGLICGAMLGASGGRWQPNNRAGVVRGWNDGNVVSNVG